MTQPMPGLRRARTQTSAQPLRVLVASGDPRQRQLLCRLVADRYAPAVPFEAADVPAAVEALVTMHPNLVLADLKMDGHAQGGLRAVLDAVSLGVRAVVVGSETSAVLQKRLRELGVGWVRKGAGVDALISAVDSALRQHAGLERAPARTRVQQV